ncbi:MAG: hypothetical protein M3Z75_30130 [Actinomycetota bacterium]|nr:hypothetical protein [Actinomycetota bacterium]
MLSTATVPAIAGAAVRIIYALVTGGAVAAIAGVALLIAYAVGRQVLDRRRLAGWETAWARIGPLWTAPR